MGLPHVKCKFMGNQHMRIDELKNNFILIGLVQSKTAVEHFNNLRKYDTEDEWTHGFNDNDLMKLCEDLVSHNKEMLDDLIKYGFKIYDTSTEREQVFCRIIEDIKHITPIH